MTELDATTQAKIDRGKRIVELFKQPQYSPIPVDVQVAVIWAVQNGVMDDVPLDQVKAFQAGCSDFLATRQPDILHRIRTEQTLGTELLASLTAAAAQFKQTWVAS